MKYFVVYLSFFSLLQSSVLFAKHPLAGNTQYAYQAYRWRTTPILGKLSTAERLQNAVVLKDKRILEFFQDPHQHIRLLETHHQIVHLNTDLGVNQYNKLHLFLQEGERILQLQARFVSKEGKVIELNQDQIFSVNKANWLNQKFFAFAGVEVGGEVEFFYTILRNANESGSEVFQREVKTKNIDFEIITPHYLLFNTQSYNGFPQMVLDQDRYTNRMVWFSEVSEVEALPYEPLSYHHANLMRVDYQLLTHTEAKSLWNSTAKAFRKKLYHHDDLKTKDKLVIENLLKQIFQHPQWSTDEKIRAIEDYIKTNIQIVSGGLLAVDNQPISVLQNKYANITGVVRLYATLFWFAHLDHQLVLTSNRTIRKFDDDFESSLNLSDFLFYFPHSDQYISPKQAQYRYGLLPYEFVNNKALFMDISSDLTDAFETKTKFIDHIGYGQNSDITTLKIRFDQDLEQALIMLERQLSGYQAAQLKHAQRYATTEQQKKNAETWLQNWITDAQFGQITTHNSNTVFDDHLTVKAQCTSQNLTENAGNLTVFRVGQLASHTTQYLPETTQRQTNVELDYQKVYHKTIEITIPQNYIVRNLDVLNQNVYLDDNGERIAAFTTLYELEGNIIKLNVEEYYKRIDYTKEQYPQLLKVMNAAADFRKIGLIFQRIAE